MESIFVGRQPIFDRNQNVVGYELLYRDGGSANEAIFNDADRATSQVISNVYLEIGIERVVGSKRAFINFTEGFLKGDYPIPFTPEQIVIEVPETLPIDAPITETLRGLAKRGFQIAMDDVTCIDNLKLVLDVARIIKIDLRGIAASVLPETVRQLRRFPTLLLAEKVETQEEFAACKDLGFDYFQGYFLSKPKVLKGQKLQPSRIVILNLLAKLQNPEISFRELEEILAQDVSLGYKLLRLVNSTYYGLPVKVKSLNQAMAMLGLEQIRSWLTLFLLTETANKPRELTNIALQRARMCEVIAETRGFAQPERYFLTGLFSVLDALYDQPMDEVLALLPLSAEINDALLERKGTIGGVLRMVLAYEHAQWEEIEQMGLDPALCNKTYLDAIEWAANVERMLGQ